ncbi:MBL fold metallo-hydrolase [Polycladidibacter stylochi]|uniref:MBL fold metallo-hydrolase n=1 Tax=Polycladidibacter stylochi TaxID=1807766 RepID=UPI00082BC8D6|nr:MBL fold metallo-hydrolase [Pseudovibrio stylochi]
MSAGGQLKITVLGCGSSTGVPRVGNDWGKCNPENPRNRRRRCALLVERFSDEGSTVVLVDTGPDMREQVLSAGISHVDAVVYTHPHADHIHGIDDIRFFVMKHKRVMPVYMDEATADRVLDAFGYCFHTPPGSSYPPILADNRLVAGKSVTISGKGGDIPVLPFLVHHGDIDALGFRFGPLAYTPDVHDIPVASLEHLQGLDTWVIDALRHTPHRSHFCLDDALAWLEKIAPKQGILTNMHSEIDYDAVQSLLPEHVKPAFDGLSFWVDL